MISEKEKRQSLRWIKRHLKSIPEVDERNYQEIARLIVDDELLEEIFWDVYGDPCFTPREMRKLDLSRLSFINEKLEGLNLSYTNAKLIEPQKAKERSCMFANFEGLDLSEAIWDNCYIEGANLTNTHSIIDLNTIGGYSDKTKLAGCYIMLSSLIDRRIPLNMIDGAHFIDDISREKADFTNNGEEKPKVLTIGPLY